MSMLDKMVAAIAPTETETQRQDARAKARELAAQHGWLASVLRHHEQIEEAFANLLRTDDTATRRDAQGRLGMLLTSHAIAEESVLYPALAKVGERSHAATAYHEQAEAKLQMAELERLPAMSADYLEKLEEIRKAVAHHVYSEEATWFVELATRASMPDQGSFESRYELEFARQAGPARSDAGVRAYTPAAPISRRPTSELNYGATDDRSR